MLSIFISYKIDLLWAEYYIEIINSQTETQNIPSFCVIVSQQFSIRVKQHSVMTETESHPYR